MVGFEVTTFDVSAASLQSHKSHNLSSSKIVSELRRYIQNQNSITPPLFYFDLTPVAIRPPQQIEHIVGHDVHGWFLKPGL